MQPSGWLQFALYFAALVLITKPMGLYLLQVLDANGRTWLDPVLRPLERLTYRLMGVDSSKEHNWKQYTLAMLLFSLVSCLFTYAILRLQNLLPLIRRGLAPSARILRSIPRSVSRPIPTGRATSAKQRCPTSRRWSGWPFTISSAPPPALPSPLPSLGQLRGIQGKRSGISGSISSVPLTICCSRSASSSQSFSSRRE